MNENTTPQRPSIFREKKVILYFLLIIIFLFTFTYYLTIIYFDIINIIYNVKIKKKKFVYNSLYFYCQIF